MGNTNELLTYREIGEVDKNIEWKERELVSAFMDPRLCLDSRVMTKEMQKHAVELFKKGYVDFYATMKAFDRNKNLERKKMEKKIKTTSSTETDSNTKELQKEQHTEILKVCLLSDDNDCESDGVSDVDSDDYNSESVLARIEKIRKKP